MEKKNLRNPSTLNRSQFGMGAEEDAAARREFIKALRAAKEPLPTTATATATATATGTGTSTATDPSATATTTVTVTATATSTDQENGEHIEEQVDQPTLPGPMDAPEDASKESVNPTKESDEVEETMGT